MSKNKENAPIRFHRRVSSSNIGLSATQQSDEFFTDSILESDATRTSKIPTPVPQKVIQTKSRRSRRPIKLEKGSATTISKDKGLQPAIDLQRTKSPSPLRNRAIGTPPQTRVRTDLASPSVEIQSPPPQEFTDVYRQIADEEDLAATERELSSSDDSLPPQSDDENAVILDHHLPTQRNTAASPALSRSRRSVTPTRQSHNQHKLENMTEDLQEKMSNHSGMSFLNDMTDQALAAKLTPHVSESAKDRARLKEVWSNQKPVAFSKAGKLKPTVTRDQDYAIISTPRIKAFSKVARNKPFENDTDRLGRPESRHSDGSVENYALRTDSWEHSILPLKELPTNARLERNFHFSRRHGFPQSRPALTEQNLEQQNRGGGQIGRNQLGLTSPISHHSDPVLGNLRASDLGHDMHKEYSVRVQRTRDGVPEPSGLEVYSIKNESKQVNDESAIDWAMAAANVPLPSKEDSSLPLAESHPPEPYQRNLSPEKSRKLEVDFTGQSFQVSESPPVRNKPAKHDPSLGKEIENLTRRAVTTSRLGEIRERNSLEQLRVPSKSPVPQTRSTSSERKYDSFRNAQFEKSESIGEPVPNTPVVIYRSSSSGSNERQAWVHDNNSKSNSDEYLQRFARAVSSTPKSSPASTVAAVSTDQPPARSQNDPRSRQGVDRRSKGNEIPSKSSVRVAETPKVTGAWTDTVLPDTAKTIKQTAAQARYTQTPHVSAGGWIDTPMPTAAKNPIEMTPIMEEVPEELVKGIVKDKAQQDDRIVAISNANHGAIDAQANVPKVGLAGILDRAKHRLISQDITTAAHENDTLNLGNETIESLQDLLTLDPDEFTVLSKVFNDDEDGQDLGEVQAEAVILERIGAKLDRLRNNIHEARKGISKLEHKVSQPDSTHLHDHDPATVMCTNCSKGLFTTSPYSQSGSLPVAPLHITLPIPLLFYFEPKPAGGAYTGTYRRRFPRPTPLGYFTLAIWLWYVVECTLCEIYSHPTHAEYYTWPSPYHSEPEFPFVLPTMLARWCRLENLASIGPFLFGWLFTFLRAITRMVGMWTGLTDGFMDSTTRSKMAQTISSTTATSMGFETDMSMMNDEFI